MWSYYGSKTNVVKCYPTPKNGKIIEPFAGAAKYSLEYFENDVLLVDRWSVIIDVWKYLQSATPMDIIKLPHPKYGENIDTFNLSAPEKYFLGFVVGCGANRPRKVVGYRKTLDRPNHVPFTLKRIANNLFKIKHWKFLCDTYESIPNQKATWFVDPPYQHGGEAYAFSNKHINFTDLSVWCRNRTGQVIVCENTKANWMQFIPMKRNRGSLKTTTEAIWCNEKTHYDNVQLRMAI